MNRLLMLRLLMVVASVLLITGFPACSRMSHGGWQAATGELEAAIPNPVSVPMVSRELVMDEVSDEIDDYFRILREQQIRLTDNILTEGWIDTEPRIGSTILEPWRKDSMPGFERMHASLQSVRRWARVRVIPNGNQYLVDVKVYKELEDLIEPENSTVSGKLYQHENALDLDRFEHNANLDTPASNGWIPMGRDCALEQKILGNIQERIQQATMINSGHR